MSYSYLHIGTDYDRLHFCDVETQQRNFRRQFALQRATGLPMFLHLRAATEDFCRIVREEWADVRGVVHSFTGSVEELNQVGRGPSPAALRIHLLQ